MAAARAGDLTAAFESVKTMQSKFGDTWRMDNPLVNFGQSPYEPGEPINLTVDNFASAGALLRGLFEYLYTSVDLTLVPHVPDNITAYKQNFPVRWGPYSLFISTEGTCSSGIGSITVNGSPAGAEVKVTNGTHSSPVPSICSDPVGVRGASRTSISAVLMIRGSCNNLPTVSGFIVVTQICITFFLLQAHGL